MIKKFNVLSYYRKGLARKGPEKPIQRPTRIILINSYLNPKVKELRDQETGKCIGLIEKEDGLYKAINFKKKKAGFSDMLSAVSFITGSYKNRVSGAIQEF